MAIRRRPPPATRLVGRRTGTLAQPIQDASAAAVDGTHALLLGGLTAADTSSDAIRTTALSGDAPAGRLPTALHDSAAVLLGDAVYLFGGWNGTRQLDQILRVPAAGGRPSVAGRLPAPSSDQAAARIGRTAYVVGGYTGSRWLDTIVAWRPGAGARIVAHLPSPLRYAAVTAVGNRLVIAGGSLPAGTASKAVLEYMPAEARIRRIGSLPAPITHAAAASLGGVAYIIGGRGASRDTQTRRIVAVDVRSGRVRLGGHLPRPLSDVAAVALDRGILIAGGRSSRGAAASVLALSPRRAATQSAKAHAHRRNTHPLTTLRNLYAFDGVDMLSQAVRGDPARVYVPNSASNTVDVIDQRTYRVVEHLAVGGLPQHVTPSYDLRRLYVDNDIGNSLTPIDPRTGRAGTPIPVDDPYNLYFTPGGRDAIVVAERLHRLDFRTARGFRLRRSLAVPCGGVNHMDFSADGSYAIASCEFSGQLLKIDVRRVRLRASIHLPRGYTVPQDVRASPDGSTFFVADLAAGGVWKIDGKRFRVTGFVPTGGGAHGLVVSRDGRFLYVANRNEGSVSVISFGTQRVVRKWWIPGGSPDMGGVSADGRVLWLSGRYNAEVYAISTVSGRLLARVNVGFGPHGLSVWPQPGRYSLGHTGNLR